MRSLSAFVVLFLSSCVCGETVLVQWERGGMSHRVMYDTSMRPQVDGAGTRDDWRFQLWTVEAASLQGDGRWVTDEGLARMWTPWNGSHTILQFNSPTAGGLNLVFDGRSLSELPRASRLPVSESITLCEASELNDSVLPDGHSAKGRWPALNCPSDSKGDSVSWMSLESTFGMFDSGDANRDFVVNFQDFVLFANDFSSAESVAAVPEPSAVFILVLGLIVVAGRHRSGA